MPMTYVALQPGKIDHPEDYVALQMDINSVNNWIKGNYLTFNASKC